MDGLDGKWVLDVVTLAGPRRFDVTLTTAGASVTGTAVGPTGPVPVRNGTTRAGTVEFTLDFAAPVPMTLAFTLRVVGDRLSGTAQSGILPPATVLGTRKA